jgi:hypothetical protein
LYESIRKHDPDYKIILVTYEGFKHTPPVDDNLIVMDEQMPIKTAAKGRYSVLSEILKQSPDLNHLVLIGSDCQLLSNPIELRINASKYDVILTPHITKPIHYDNKFPNMPSIHLSGLYNSDVTLFSNTPNAIQILDWLCGEPFIMDSGMGFFNEQTYFNYIPIFFPNVLVLQHEGYNIAYWNIHQRDFKFEDGEYKVGDKKARIIHFSGFTTPEAMSTHQNRWVATGDILKVYTEYQDKLNEMSK